MAKSKQRNKESGNDAISMLMADHQKVKGLFEEFKSLKEADADSEEKSQLVEQICTELKIHTAIEEEIFYPAVREAIDEADLMDEALVEHAGAKDLIEQLEGADPEDDLYDAKVTVLGEQIDHHVTEEETEMFAKAKEAGVDTAELGAQMAERKTELMAEAESSADDDEDDEESQPPKKHTDTSRSDRRPG